MARKAGFERFLSDDPEVSDALLSKVEKLVQPLDDDEDLYPLLKRIGGAKCVLVGEASHGTSDYYVWRARLSKKLIAEKGFNFVAVEGDWPDCYKVNAYVKNYPDSEASARDVLKTFKRWPTWMWANEEIVEFVEWLREYNDGLPSSKKIGFYGLDVYSLWDSLHAIIAALRQFAPDAIPLAREAMRCFEPYGEDAHAYARATALVPTSCETEVVELLERLRYEIGDYGEEGREAFFQAEQNALVVKNAEAYYRAMVRGGPNSWNLRDRHMAETVDRLMLQHGSRAKGLIWEHNTHIGDARFTDMLDDGMVNVGQLARGRYGADQVVLIGFGSYEGSVIAGREWEAPMQKMPVPMARRGSWEDVLHRAGGNDKLWLFSEDNARDSELLASRGHRAIGVVYHPEREQFGNYVPTVLPRRYDAFLYIDVAEALHPLPIRPRHDGDYPETFPSAL